MGVRCEGGAARPFWTGPRFRDSISHLKPGGTSPGLSERNCAILATAGVLVNAEEEAQRNDRWEQAFSRSSRLFRERGYAAGTGLIHPFHIGSCCRYYRHLLRTGGMQLGDSGSARRWVTHNESTAVFFHRQMMTIVGKLAGVPVKPSYVYVAVYQDGANLPVHTDRAQCEYSITMLVDATPEPSGKSPWPLYLVTGTGDVPIRQSLGEALFYRGLGDSSLPPQPARRQYIHLDFLSLCRRRFFRFSGLRGELVRTEMTAVLANDTRGTVRGEHWGSWLTSTNLKAQLTGAGSRNHRSHPHGSVEADQPIWTRIAKAGVLVINGEGSVHSGRSTAVHILDSLRPAKKEGCGFGWSITAAGIAMN